MLQQPLGTPAQKAQLVVMCYGRCVDLRNLHRLLPELPPASQVAACQALGVLGPCTSLAAPDLHYVVRMDRADEREMARRLCRVARFNPRGPNFRRLTINGLPARLPEDYRLWAYFTGARPARSNLPQIRGIADLSDRTTGDSG